MSLRAFGTLFMRTAQTVADRFLLMFGRRTVPVRPAELSKIVRPIVGKKAKRTAGIFTRLLWRTINRSTITAVRAATVGIWQHSGHLHGTIGEHSIGRRTFIMHQSQIQRLSAFELIRKLKHLSPDERQWEAEDNFDWPTTIGGYDLGENLAVGCNGAVYEARLARPNQLDRIDASWTDFYAQDSSYPLAIKMLFNYNYMAPSTQIWRDNEAEAVPISLKGSYNYQMITNRPISCRHAHVVRLHAAFIDDMPVLCDAHKLYPAAVPPNIELALPGCQPVQTMFLVFKRYTQTLNDYVKHRPPSGHCSKVLFAQLLEAITFLYKQKISHRDLKSDNILLEIDQIDQAPWLVLTDFGSCLSNPAGTMKLHYFDDFTDLGGNLALRAPEIRCARPGPNITVDFTMADLWACGTLAYEIFDSWNPFYGQFKSDQYRECELPPMSNTVDLPIKALVADMLRIAPELRPCPSVAATSACLSLLPVDLSVCIQDVKQRLKQSNNHVRQLVDDLITLFAVQSILTAKHMGRAEKQLRRTFLDRVKPEEVASALRNYYLPPNALSFVNA